MLRLSSRCLNIAMKVPLWFWKPDFNRWACMATRRQLEANRANAKRSSGPKTLAGKARSKGNALKHGLSAATIVMGDEDPREFDTIRDQLRMQLGATGIIEEELADQIAGVLWRLRRIPRIEAAMIRIRVEAAEEQDRCDRLSIFQHGDDVGEVYNRLKEAGVKDDDKCLAELATLQRKEDTPAVTKRKQIDDALSRFMADLPNLSRYNIALLNDLKRLLAMLASVQKARREVANPYLIIESSTHNSPSGT
jgi:hypothetical protein